MRTRERRILVSLPDGYHLYGFLNTGLARRLVAGGCPITFVVPQGTVGLVEDELARAAEWLEFPMREFLMVRRMGKVLRLEASHHLRGNSTWEMIRLRYARRPLRRVVQKGLGRLLATWPRLELVLSAAENILEPSPLRSALDPHGYDTVIFGSSAIKELDLAVVQMFRRLNVKRYGIVYSWDNISSKFNCFCRFDRLAVWNEHMRGEAVRDLGYSREQVAMVGPPQFDCYHGFAPSRPRSEFLTAHGLPPDARYILYAGVNNMITPWNTEYVENILTALPEHHVLVRNHPQDHPLTYSRLDNHSRLRVCDAGSPSGPQERRRGFWLPRSDESLLLAEQIFHADIVATVASTVTLESLILDRPVVNIAFDVDRGSFPLPMSSYYQTQHYRQVTKSGAVEIAESPQGLVSALRNVDTWWPSRRARKDSLNRLIDPFGDGRATERLAEDILAFHGAG